jgi:uncharacterized OB-fold protein
LTELQIFRCETCGTSLFPARLRCPDCGGTRFTQGNAGPGSVEEETTLRRAPTHVAPTHVRLGSVRLAAGPVVIARLEHGATAGANVRLEQAPDGAVKAHRAEDREQRSN